MCIFKKRRPQKPDLKLAIRSTVKPDEPVGYYAWKALFRVGANYTRKNGETYLQASDRGASPDEIEAMRRSANLQTNKKK